MKGGEVMKVKTGVKAGDRHVKGARFAFDLHPTS